MKSFGITDQSGYRPWLPKANLFCRLTEGEHCTFVYQPSISMFRSLRRHSSVLTCDHHAIHAIQCLGWSSNTQREVRTIWTLAGIRRLSWPSSHQRTHCESFKSYVWLERESPTYSEFGPSCSRLRKYALLWMWRWKLCNCVLLNKKGECLRKLYDQEGILILFYSRKAHYVWRYFWSTVHEEIPAEFVAWQFLFQRFKSPAVDKRVATGNTTELAVFRPSHFQSVVQGFKSIK